MNTEQTSAIASQVIKYMTQIAQHHNLTFDTLRASSALKLTFAEEFKKMQAEVISDAKQADLFGQWEPGKKMPALVQAAYQIATTHGFTMWAKNILKASCDTFPAELN